MSNQVDPNNNQQPVQPVNPVQPVQPEQPVQSQQVMMQQQPVVQPVQPMIQPVPVQQSVVGQAPAALPVEPQKKKTNGLCIAALIFAFLIPLVGLILGIIGIGSSKKKGQKGKGLAVTAIIISLLIPIITVIIAVSLFVNLLNGDNAVGDALREGCAEVDRNGDYESHDGRIVCEDNVCTYTDDGISLSASCTLIKPESDEEDEDIEDAEYEEEQEEVENEDTEFDEEDVTDVTKPQSNYSLANTSWVLSDSSEMVFGSDGFNWYKDENIYTDNYYTGTYEVYVGATAVEFITVNLSSYGITKQELEDYFARNEGYGEDNFMVLVLNNQQVIIDGNTQILNNMVPYYGFVLKSGTYLDLANMNTASYTSFTKKDK